jgi:hypothetical protein
MNLYPVYGFIGVDADSAGEADAGPLCSCPSGIKMKVDESTPPWRISNDSHRWIGSLHGDSAYPPARQGLRLATLGRNLDQGHG